MNQIKRVININLISITTDEPFSEVPCGSCTVCCEKLAPFLTPEEINSGLYPLSLIESPDGPVVTLYRKKEGGCGMFINSKCSIYEYRPKACRQFDCRKNHHPNIPNMVK